MFGNDDDAVATTIRARDDDDASADDDARGVVVRARRASGADVGPVRVGAEATVGELRRAIFDAAWSARDADAGAETEDAPSEKPPSAAHVMLLCDGRMLGPDERTLRECGLRADGRERVLHAVVSSRAAPWSERSERVATSDKAGGGGGAGQAVVATQPTCCSVM